MLVVVNSLHNTPAPLAEAVEHHIGLYDNDSDAAVHVANLANVVGRLIATLHANGALDDAEALACLSGMRAFNLRLLAPRDADADVWTTELQAALFRPTAICEFNAERAACDRLRTDPRTGEVLCDNGGGRALVAFARWFTQTLWPDILADRTDN